MEKQKILVGLLLLAVIVIFILPFGQSTLIGESLSYLSCIMNSSCTLANLTVTGLTVLGNATFNGTIIAEHVHILNLTVNSTDVTGYIDAYGYKINGTDIEDTYLRLNASNGPITENLSIDVRGDGDASLLIMSGINKNSVLRLMESDTLGFNFWYDGSGTNYFGIDSYDGAGSTETRFRIERSKGNTDILANLSMDDNRIKDVECIEFSDASEQCTAYNASFNSSYVMSEINGNVNSTCWNRSIPGQVRVAHNGDAVYTSGYVIGDTLAASTRLSAPEWRHIYGNSIDLTLAGIEMQATDVIVNALSVQPLSDGGLDIGLSGKRVDDVWAKKLNVRANQDTALNIMRDNTNILLRANTNNMKVTINGTLNMTQKPIINIRYLTNGTDNFTLTDLNRSLSQGINDTDARLKNLNISESLGIGIDPKTSFHLGGTIPKDFGTIDTGLNFDFVGAPAKVSLNLLNLAGNIDAGDHIYYVTYYTEIGETNADTSAPQQSITADATHAQCEVTIPVSTDYRVIGRRIYRTKAGESYYKPYLLTDVTNNVDTLYLDNTADADLTGTEQQGYWRPDLSNAMILKDNETVMVIDRGLTMIGDGAGNGDLMTTGGTTGYGANVLNSLTSGSQNACFGDGACDSVTVGSYNTCEGKDACGSVTTAGGNVGNGRNSLLRATGSSVGIGYAAGQNVDGSRNVFLGQLAGYGTGTPDVDYTVSAGYNSLFALSSDTADYIICIGSYCADSATGISYSIIIGNDIEAPSNTAANQLNIGNLIFSQGVDGTGTTLSTGNIGIGTSEPTHKLTVMGDTNTTGDLIVGGAIGTGNKTAPPSGINTTYLWADLINGASPIKFGDDPDVGYTRFCVKDAQGYGNLVYWDGGKQVISANSKLCNDYYAKIDEDMAAQKLAYEERKAMSSCESQAYHTYNPITKGCELDEVALCLSDRNNYYKDGNCYENPQARCEDDPTTYWQDGRCNIDALKLEIDSCNGTISIEYGGVVCTPYTGDEWLEMMETRCRDERDKVWDGKECILADGKIVNMLG